MKLIKNKFYQNTCVIFSPYGIIRAGAILSSEVWKKILVYELGDNILKLVPKPKKNDKRK